MEAYDDWDGTVDDDDIDDEPEWEAESDCIQCGGQGGWIKPGKGPGREIWVWCDCVTFRGEQS